MTALQDILEKPIIASRMTPVRAIMIGIGAFVLWAFVARLEEFAIAEGEVIPQEQIQTIQHLEGGIIEKIHVFEGDRVKVGQPLIQLNLTSAAADRDEQKIKQFALLLKKVRLEAEAEGKETLEFGEEFKDIRPAMKEAEIQTFQSRKAKQEAALATLKEQAQQKQLEITQLITERDTTGNNLGLLRERLRMSEDLMANKLISKMEHLQLKSEVQTLQGRLEVVKVSIPKGEAALAEAREKLKSEELHFRNQAREELNQVVTDLARIGEMLSKSDDQVSRTTIKSPIDGVVKALKTHTIGGVVTPGEAIMEIVPASANLVIETKLDPRDIGFVKVGQKALVKFTTYDYARYGGLDGEVISVSADSHTDKSGPQARSYFRVVVRTNKSDLGDKDSPLPITPGMPATAEIRTGSKTVMQYLLKPVIKVKHEAFRER
ncbi:MAG: HlyD family type I secretion periplasmic adaptor subunit [Alphaproteobacteria bacterium]|nr:HlyD family type I secretion periplasmic adaptor subunit [Alphaproteobacteria bacterium]